jgi:hypothetical protein
MKPEGKKAFVTVLVYSIGVAFGMYAMTHVSQGVMLSIPGTVCIFVIRWLISWSTSS